MSRSATSAALPATSATEHRPPGRDARWVLPVALMVTLAPFVVAAARAVLTLGDSLHYAGDQAVFALATRDASKFSQLLGPYSRFGWSHPGPSWFYLLAPVYRAFGGSDAALVASNIVVNGLFAAAVVIAVHRFTRPALTLVTAGLVLLYVLRMPAIFFVQVWSPFALLLATMLFLLLAGRARDGRWSTLLLLIAVGSFLVQTHIGTAPLVGAVGIAGLAAFILGRREAHRRAADRDDVTGDRPSRDRQTAAPAAVAESRTARGGRRDATAAALGIRRRRAAVALSAVLLAAMWVGPFYQQLSVPLRDGNLSRLATFFLFHGDQGPHPTLYQALIAVGRLLAMTPYGWDPGPYEMDVTTLPAAVAVGLLAQAAASLLLVAAGRRWHSRSALWTGVVTFLALLAAIAATHTVTGGLYWYLITWVTVLPAVTLVGAAQLAFDRPTRGGSSWRAWAAPDALARATPLLVTTSVLLAAGAAACAVSLDQAVPHVPGSAGVEAAVQLVDRALQGRPRTDIEVDIQTHDRWPLGAGLVEDLTDEGWRVHVGPQNADLFGAGRVTRTRQPVELILVAPDDPKLPTLIGSPRTLLGSVDTESGPVAILLEIDR